MPYKIVVPGAAREGITNLMRMAEQKMETARAHSETFAGPILELSTSYFLFSNMNIFIFKITHVF